ncbi:hypothetical protein PRZ48_000035 [Zasmidium cellare]|uniref:Carrier domain-containing protein n=1 Tax=Zasmidium cellare TaxID=395010 RepID=A0ABR0EYM0_ZASCE|nr:hypothetical protein PRZ48_000035 [Zasmidium cellare]
MADQLRSLWAQVLDISEADIKDDSNFFEIGGDSVATIKLSGIANDAGLRLSSQTIFENPTLSDQAQAAEEKRNGKPSTDSSSATPSSGQDIMQSWDLISTILAQCNIPNHALEDIYPCTPFQAELMRGTHELGVWMFQAVFEVGPNSLARAKKALGIIRQRNPVFRSRIAQHESGLYHVIVKGRPEWKEYHGDLEAYKQTDLSQRMGYGEQLDRLTVVYEPDTTYIVWTKTHGVYDRWSKIAFIDDLHQCFTDPEAFQNRPLRPPFRKFVDHVSSQDREQGIEFWKSQLEGVERYDLLFPEDKNRQFATSRKKTLRKMVKYKKPTTKIGLDAITQVAWALTLANESGEDDIFFMAMRSSRQTDLEGIENIIGPLWTLCPVRRRLVGNETLQTLLERVSSSTHEAIPYEQFGLPAALQHFGHRRFLAFVSMPQPPQPESFAAKSTARDEQGEYWMRSAEKQWTQARGTFGLYVTCTPKGDEDMEIWARWDEHFINADRVSSICDKYSQMLEKLFTGDCKSTTIGQLCPHLAGSGADEKANGHLNGDSKPATLSGIFRNLSNTAPALIIPGEKEQKDLILPHAKLHNLVAKVQQDFADLGIKEGSACSIALPNSMELIQEEFEFYIEDLGSDVVIIPKDAYAEEGHAVKAARKYEAAIAECYWDGKTAVVDIKEEGKMAKAKNQDKLEAQKDDVALVLHTSGTTGRPKAVPLTHENLLTSIVNIINTYELTSKDITMLIMPLFHVHGLLASFLSPLYSGGSAIVPKRLEPSFWSVFDKHKATWYTATPSMHRVILQFPEPSRAALDRVRFIRSCSSQLSPSLLKQLEDKFKSPVLESYAMTEASHLMCSNPLPHIGEHYPGSGYLNNPDANKSSFTSDGFFRTGDQGKLDEKGYLFLTGRLKELINKGGEKISPVELDNVINQHEKIQEAVSFAIDDEGYGQDVGCAVKLADGQELDTTELKKWVSERLSNFKVPKKIWICEDIPKTATGKVQRKMVAEAMAKRQE